MWLILVCIVGILSLTSCTPPPVDPGYDRDQPVPTASETITPELPTQPSPHVPDKLTVTPSFEISTDPSEEFGYLLIGSKEGQALRALDLATGGQVDYRTIEWREATAVDLNPLVSEQGLIALREEYGYLNIYHVNEKEALNRIWLLNEDLFKSPSEPNSIPYQQYFAVTSRWATPRWSPTDPVLAFAAALDDEWVSVYALDARTDEITRLTPRGSHALPLFWSADGQHLVAVLIESFQRDRYAPKAIVILDVALAAIKVRKQIYVRSPLQVIEWTEDSDLYFVGVLPDGRLTKLHQFDSTNGEMRMLLDGPFLDVAISPENEYAIISSPTVDKNDQFVLYDLDLSDGIYVQYSALEGEVGEVEWYPSLDAFAVECSCGTHLIGVDGSVLRHFSAERGLPRLSPDGDSLAFGPGGAFYDTDLRIYSSEGELQFDSGMRTKDIAWWWDSRGLVFSKSIGGTALVQLGPGIVSEPWYSSGNGLSLILADVVPFSELPFKPPPSPTTTPDPQEPSETPQSTAVLTADRLLSSGTELTIMDLDMQDETNGWALGRAANDRFMRVLRTEDGGETWRDVTPPKDSAPSKEYLEAHAYGGLQRSVLYAFDDQQAWVTYAAPTDLSRVMIWRTNNGGLTWDPSDPVNIWSVGEHGPWISGYLPIAITFSDQQHGWILAITELPGLMMAADTVLLRTEDGGHTWDFILGSSIQGLEGFEFLDRNHGWMLNASTQPEWSKILQTTDGGEYWFNDPSLPVGYQADEFRPYPACMGAYQLQKLHADELFMIIWCIEESFTQGNFKQEEKNYLYTSKDGGKSWFPTLLPIRQRPDISLSYDFITSEIGWLFDYESGVIFWTTSGGEAWEAIKEVNWEGELDFIDHLHGWGIIWERGASYFSRELSLVRTSDGGYTWKIVQPKIR